MAIQNMKTAETRESDAGDKGQHVESSAALCAVEVRFEYLQPPIEVQFILLRGPSEAKSARSAVSFTTEEEARAAHSRLQASASERSEWTEVVKIGGGERPAVVVWSGRPFPPVAAEEALAQGWYSRQADETTGRP